MTSRRWDHEPVWEPAQLPIDAAGNTLPGFTCVYELENGNGPCGSNVFRIEDAIGTHSCFVVVLDEADDLLTPDDVAAQVADLSRRLRAQDRTSWCTCALGRPCSMHQPAGGGDGV